VPIAIDTIISPRVNPDLNRLMDNFIFVTLLGYGFPSSSGATAESYHGVIERVWTRLFTEGNQNLKGYAKAARRGRISNAALDSQRPAPGLKIQGQEIEMSPLVVIQQF
jgi:hypothetical protein